MLKDRIGNPKQLGRAIAAAKGRVRTYFKKRVRKWPLQIGVALVLAFAFRAAVAEVFYIPTGCMEPMIPRGARVMVYKLAHTFNPGDVVVFRKTDGTALIGTIERQSNSGWLIRKDAAVQDVPADRIVGRVFLNTR